VVKVGAKSQSDKYLGMEGVARDHNEKRHMVWILNKLHEMVKKERLLKRPQ
jgi:hypothetical protein